MPNSKPEDFKLGHYPDIVMERDAARKAGEREDDPICQTFKEWWISIYDSTDASPWDAAAARRLANSAWNAAKASSPAVAGGESEMEKLYYIQDARQFVGNSVMWWRPDGHGYTSDLKQAWKVPEAKAKSMHRSRSTDIPWVCSDIDSAAKKHFDMQNLRNFQPLIKDVRGKE